MLFLLTARVTIICVCLLHEIAETRVKITLCSDTDKQRSNFTSFWKRRYIDLASLQTAECIKAFNVWVNYNFPLHWRQTADRSNMCLNPCVTKLQSGVFVWHGNKNLHQTTLLYYVKQWQVWTMDFWKLLKFKMQINHKKSGAAKSSVSTYVNYSIWNRRNRYKQRVAYSPCKNNYIQVRSSINGKVMYIYWLLHVRVLRFTVWLTHNMNRHAAKRKHNGDWWS